MTEAVSTRQVWIDFAYLVTGICFIMGLRYMSSPKTARFGNSISIGGMALAGGGVGRALNIESIRPVTT